MPHEDPVHPSQRLVDFYKERLRESRSHLVDLREDVEACRKMAEESMTKESEAVRVLSDTSALQENLSQLQSLLYQEKENVVYLKSENERLEIERLEDKKKIAFLLRVSGMKESDINLEDPETMKTTGTSTRKKVRFKEIKSFNKNLQQFKEESQSTVLRLRVDSLESQLKKQTCLLHDRLISQASDMELRKNEWEMHKKRLMAQTNSLVYRLRNAQEYKFFEIDKYLEELDSVRVRDLKLMEENDKLKRSLAMCKELLGDNFENFKSKRKDEALMSLREKIVKMEQEIKDLTDEKTDLLDEIGIMKALLDGEREQRQKDKERLTTREEYLKKKVDEEKKRRLLDTEGFAADVKLLRSKLQSVERQIRQDNLRRRHQKD